MAKEIVDDKQMLEENAGMVEIVDTAEVAEIDAAAAPVIKLSKAMSDGTEALMLDFDRVNGMTMLQMEKAARKEDPGFAVPSLSGVFQAMIAAKAAGKRYDDILRLNCKDFTAVCLKVQSFLLG